MRLRPTSSYPGLVVLLLLLLVSADRAEAFALGSADVATASVAALEAAAALGSRSSRVVIDPHRPLNSYSDQIAAIERAGMRPQIVIGGLTTTTSRKVSPGWLAKVAVLIHRRWPGAFSLSILNEPELQGVGLKHYCRVFRHSYKALKAAGARRVLFGELSPAGPGLWFPRIAKGQCGKVTADGFAWHAYDFGKDWLGALRNVRQLTRWLKALRPHLRTPRGFTLPRFATEYGFPVRDGKWAAPTEREAADSWRRAIARAQRADVTQLVIYHISAVGEESQWDTSILRPDGSKRLAYFAIRDAR